jgi:thioesterase domain-containing protein
MTAARRPVLLRPGGGTSPLFLAHGLGGTVAEFSELVKFIEVTGPIYGLEAKGNDGMDEPFTNIEDLAQYHADAIRKVQDRGPYFLIGYSLGGLVASEIAQRALTAGDSVGLLAMIDSYPHATQLNFAQRVRLSARMTKRKLLYAMTLPKLKDALDSDLTPSMQRAYEAANVAWRNYQPRFYNGKINFVRAETSTIYPDDPLAVWGQLAAEIEIQTVAGDHHGIMTENVTLLGSTISRYVVNALKEAQ